MENDCQSSISRLPVCFRLERLSPYKSIATSELDEERRKQTVWAAQIRRPTARVSQLLSIFNPQRTALIQWNYSVLCCLSHFMRCLCDGFNLRAGINSILPKLWDNNGQMFQLIDKTNNQIKE